MLSMHSVQHQRSRGLYTEGWGSFPRMCYFLHRPLPTLVWICMVWVLVHLCNNSKALHLELIESYSTDSLVTALAKVFTIRNIPSKIQTDAGTNFKKSRSMLLTGKDYFQEFTESGLSKLTERWPQLHWEILPAGAKHQTEAQNPW